MRKVLLVFIISLSALAVDKECKDRIDKSLTSPSERYLFEKYPHLLEQFISSCEESQFGDLGLMGSIVFVHEAAHFEDLGWDNSTPGDSHDSLDLYLANGEHIGNLSETNGLPKVKEIVRPILQKQYPEELNGETIFNGMHEGYIGAEDSIAAETLQGMSTELSAYVHGLLYENKIKKQFPETVELTSEDGQTFSYPNPYKPLSQIEGVYYFLFSFNLYLDKIKKDHPEKWKILNGSQNKTFLSKIFASAIDALRKVNHCEVAKNEENASYWLELLQKETLSPALESFMNTESLLELQCVDLGSAMSEVEGINEAQGSTESSVSDSELNRKSMLNDNSAELISSGSEVIQH